jgi:hypothetical protein
MKRLQKKDSEHLTGLRDGKAGLPVTAIGYVGTRRGNIREDVVNIGGNANRLRPVQGRSFFYEKENLL